MNEQNLIISLRAPAVFYLGTVGSDDSLLAFGDQTTQAGFPPWPSAADILIDSKTREFCGVTYQVAPEFRGAVAALAASLDPKCVTYVDGGLASAMAPYQKETDDLHWLQIVWSRTIPDDIVLAQLGADAWYYSTEFGESNSAKRVVAYGVADLSSVERDFGVTLPKHFAIPSGLQVQNVDGNRITME
jgi:hypothetical protein